MLQPANRLFREGKQGYTLAEVMTVVIILGVIASLALPNFNIQVKKVKNQEAVQVLLALYSAQKDYERDHPGQYADIIDDLDIEITGLKNFQEPDVVNAGQINCKGSSLEYLASIEELNGDYTLYVLKDENEASINEAKIICAVDGDCSASLCMKMGF